MAIIEKFTNPPKIVGIPEERQGNVRGWGEMSFLIGEIHGREKFRPNELKFARAYFLGQKLIVEHPKQKDRAKRYFERLDDMLEGYSDFEFDNGILFRTIDIAVKGSTNRNY